MTLDITEFRTMRDRYQAHIDDIEGRPGMSDAHQFALRPGQIALARDWLQSLGEKNAKGEYPNHGYFVRPTGTGKTVSMIDFIIGINTLPSGKSVLGDGGRQKRALVMVPQNFLLDQWENELLGEATESGRKPSKWGDLIKAKDVGIYHAGDSFEARREALQKPIVVITYDSARLIIDDTDPMGATMSEKTETERNELQRILKPKNFSVTLLDEVHDRPRGDVTGAFIDKFFFGKSLVIGATATHLYKSGKTIGDYLFDGQIPFHETTFREAINRSEICPMRNIIAEVELSDSQKAELKKITDKALERARKKGADDEELDYTDKELERIVEISQRDEAAVRLLQRGSDPGTGKRYRDMKQVWYCASIKHAEHLAEKLNKEMGEGYAMAVHGDMSRKEQNAILINYRQGGHKVLTNCQLLTMGFDDREAELCLQLVPTRSPTRSMQQAGRVMRTDPKNKKKIANIVTFVYPNVDQVIFGELAQGMIMIPPGYEFAENSPGDSTATPRVWPQIEGLKVHYSSDQLELFADKRRQQRYVRGLPVKPDDMLTVEEMARELFPRASGEALSRETARLQRRVYEPLQAAYDMRKQRQQFVGVKPEEGQSESVTAFGQRFPVWRIGHHNYSGQSRFCINKEAAALCRYSMYGRTVNRTSDLLSEAQAKRLSGLNDEQWHSVIDRIKEAYLDRRGYERALLIDDVSIPIDTVGYYRNKEATTSHLSPVEFYLKPDAIPAVYRLANHLDAATTKQWAKVHPQLPKLKTAHWFDRQDALDALGMGLLDSRMPTFDSLWRKIEQAHKRQGPAVVSGEEKEISVALEDRSNAILTTAAKRTLTDNQEHICVNSAALGVLRFALGMESAYEPAAAVRTRRKGR
jgi:superfamily II DNA or RNA helicase